MNTMYISTLGDFKDTQFLSLDSLNHLNKHHIITLVSSRTHWQHCQTLSPLFALPRWYLLEQVSSGGSVKEYVNYA